MSLFLGIDTSNYTTSAALCCDGEIIKNIRIPLPVKEGERGLRQSDAVFAHNVNLPKVMELIGKCSPDGVGVSVSPRDSEGSYMPCFLAGIAAASAVSELNGVPLYRFSHQSGHVAAALYSCGRLELLDSEFIAFHMSGGTTELLLVSGGKITRLGGTKDISAGKAVDRIGVRMGLKFPCGAELDRLARSGKITRKAEICVNGFDCNLSGLENLAGKLTESGEARENVAAFTVDFILRTTEKLTLNALAAYPGRAVVYSGGVMSNSVIRERLGAYDGRYFASPEYSCDNAAGCALLAYRCAENTDESGK